MIYELFLARLTAIMNFDSPAPVLAQVDYNLPCFSLLLTDLFENRLLGNR